MAAIRGLEALKRPTSVELVTDSTYVGKGVSEWMPKWKQNGSPSPAPFSYRPGGSARVRLKAGVAAPRLRAGFCDDGRPTGNARADAILDGKDEWETVERRPQRLRGAADRQLLHAQRPDYRPPGQRSRHSLTGDFQCGWHPYLPHASTCNSRACLSTGATSLTTTRNLSVRTGFSKTWTRTATTRPSCSETTGFQAPAARSQTCTW